MPDILAIVVPIYNIQRQDKKTFTEIMSWMRTLEIYQHSKRSV
jgi:hypothetical protein